MASQSFIAVYTIFRRGSDVLLYLRQGTGYEDGNYGLVSGHVEYGEDILEAAIRETQEEAGVTVLPGDMRLAHVMHRRTSESPWVDFFFEADSWSGALVNREPDKCAELLWVSRDSLPSNTIPYIELALQQIATGKAHSHYGWEDRT